MSERVLITGRTDIPAIANDRVWTRAHTDRDADARPAVDTQVPLWPQIDDLGKRGGGNEPRAGGVS
jgi:hypothetical protein